MIRKSPEGLEYSYICKIGHHYWRELRTGRIVISDDSSESLSLNIGNPWETDDGILYLNTEKLALSGQLNPNIPALLPHTGYHLPITSPDGACSVTCASLDEFVYALELSVRPVECAHDITTVFNDEVTGHFEPDCDCDGDNLVAEVTTRQTFRAHDQHGNYTNPIGPPEREDVHTYCEKCGRDARFVKGNSNCLEGMRCPKCCSYGPFSIESVCMVLMTDDGDEDVTGIEWHDQSRCSCANCDHAGEVKDFKTRNSK